MRYQVFSFLGNRIPPGAQEGKLASGNLFCQNLDAFVVEWRESAEQSIQDTAECPHVHRLGIPFVLYDLWRGVTNCTARSHRRRLPYLLRQSQVANLDCTDCASTKPFNKLAFIFLIFVSGLRRRSWTFSFHEWNRVEQQVFWFDIPDTHSESNHDVISKCSSSSNSPVNDTFLFMEVPNAFGDLADAVTCKVFAEVRQADNLLEQFSTIAKFQYQKIILWGSQF